MYVDIHSHILPGIDDGSEGMEMTLDMLRIAAGNGTRHIIATPHFISGSIQNTAVSVIEKCRMLQKLAYEEGIDIMIHQGCEVFLSPDLLKLHKSERILTLSDSSYMLVELPMMSIPEYTDSLLYELQLKGINPIIAHPERNHEIIKNPDILIGFVNRGILIQSNAGSITGIYGKEVQRASRTLIRSGLVHFIASDAHNNRGRTPDISKAAHIIEKEFGSHIKDKLFYNNGLCVVTNINIAGNKSETTQNRNIVKRFISKIASIF